MAYWETGGASDEWYTPKYIFDALAVSFDLDVAAPKEGPRHVPARHWLSSDSLSRSWGRKDTFVWMNPPFGGRNALEPWLYTFFKHGNGIALTPDRTSAPWWQKAARKADAVLFVAGKVRFERPDGSVGKSPSNGTTLFAAGERALNALLNAADAGLGFLAIDREEGVRNLMGTIEALGHGIDDRDNGFPLGTHAREAREMVEDMGGLTHRDLLALAGG